jgi:hypothetical protein
MHAGEAGELARLQEDALAVLGCELLVELRLLGVHFHVGTIRISLAPRRGRRGSS